MQRHAGPGALVCVGDLEAEDYGDVDSGFDGLAAEGSRLIFPLANGVGSGGFEQRWACHLVYILDIAVAVDDYVQLDGAFNALALGVFGIYRFDARD